MYMILDNFLLEYGNDFDIIIDDGGHTMKQQQISLGILFFAVKSGGYYVIEDLHTCSGQWDTLYGYKVIEDGDVLTTDLLDSLENKNMNVLETSYLPKGTVDVIRNKIKSCITKIGVESYTNPKGQRYNWPTLLSFIELK